MINITFTKKEENGISTLMQQEDTLCMVNLIKTSDYKLDVEWIYDTPIAIESHKIDEWEWEDSEIDFEALTLDQQKLALKLYKEEIKEAGAI